jgi:D-alanine-D-alanine ligase
MKHIVVLFGGNNLEHEVSLKTGYDISKQLSLNKGYSILNVGILKTDEWVYSDNLQNIIQNNESIEKIKINDSLQKIFQIGEGTINNRLIHCVFIANHGLHCEDGKLQSYLNYNKLNYTGCSINTSWICFNKFHTKLLAEKHHIPLVDYILVNKQEQNNCIKTKIKNLNFNNYIVKINCGGSSMGVYQADNNTILTNIEKAFLLDNDVLIERDITCRELSIAVLFINKQLFISPIGEYIKNDNFFSYDLKYKKARSSIIKDLNNTIIEKISNYVKTIVTIFSIKAYCRVDFFLQNNQIYFNEINTLPGLNEDALFIKLWKDRFTYS